MGSWKLLTIAAGVALLALGAARQAGATAQDFYGDNFDENVLIPFAECGPGGVDTLFTITDPEGNTPATSLLHIHTLDKNSVDQCDFCVPFTKGDVYPESFCRIVNNVCSPDRRAGLETAPGSGIFRAYLAIEESPTGLCGIDLDIGDAFYGNIYFTDLGNNRATGLPAATYDPTLPVNGVRGGAPVASDGTAAGAPADFTYLPEFPLVSGQRLSFRFLHALGGNRSAARTRAVVWSATSGTPGIAGIGCFSDAAQTLPIPDSNCLKGDQPPANILQVCNEQEQCFSSSLSLPNEINVIDVDTALVPAGDIFVTDGGYFNLQPGPGFPGQTGTFNTLHVIGITDQEGFIGSTPAVRAAFYAPRD